jgi:hypothetical protein
VNVSTTREQDGDSAHHPMIPALKLSTCWMIESWFLLQRWIHQSGFDTQRTLLAFDDKAPQMENNKKRRKSRT